MGLKNAITKFGRRCSVAYQAFFLDDQNWNELFPYASSESGEVITPATAQRCTTVFSCVRVLSETMATLPIKLVRKDLRGNSTPATDNSLYRVLLYSPNRWQTAFDYWKWNMECLCYRGWFISKVLRSPTTKQVIGLIPLHPDTVIIKQLADGTLNFSGKAMIGENTYINIDSLPQSEAFFSFYATKNSVTPASPITYNAEAIGLAIAATKHGARFLKNDATPPLVIQYPNQVSEDSLSLLAKSWKKRGTGKNTGMPRVVDYGAKIDQLSMSNQDAQYLETRQYQKEELCGIFGVPTHMISDTKRAKGWSTAEQLGIDFVTYGLNPWARRISQSIRFCLIDPKDWFTVEAQVVTQALMRGDTKTRVQYYHNMRLDGVLNANDILRLEDMNLRDDPGGDEYWKPVNYEIDPPEEEPEPQPILIQGNENE